MISKSSHYPNDVFLYAVFFYVRYAVSYRDLDEILAERGVQVDHAMPNRGFVEYSLDIAKTAQVSKLTSVRSWRMPFGDITIPYRVLHTADGEEAAGNVIRFNQFVIMASGFPKTAEMLRSNGYEVREINNTECAKIDGTMSCLSLRF